MTPFDSAVANRLAKRVAADSFINTEHVRSGAADDFANYKERCGYLRALDNVTEWIKQIESDLRQGK